MNADRRLYRGNGAVAGGVCAGIAAYFGADSIVVRILAVMLAIVTCGFAVLVYVLLWIALPRMPRRSEPYDITPDEAHSDAYGSFNPARLADANDSRFATAAVARAMERGSYKGVGHLPPEPPAGACCCGENAKTRNAQLHV